MADNAWQSRAIVKAAGDLEVAHPDALAVADMLVYPEEGNPRNRIAPDVLVAFGVGTHSRSSYLVWEEGKPPDWVLEVASPSTAAKDLDFKRRAYAAMGVPEYWLFDPKGDVFPAGQPQLQGLALSHGGYVRLAPRLADGLAMIRSGVLGLDLRVEGEFIRMRIRRPGRTSCIRPSSRRSPSARRSVRSGKPRNAWSRRLASRSWRPPFSLLKGALLSTLKSALSGVCGLVRATTSPEILRASTVERWRSPSSPPGALLNVVAETHAGPSGLAVCLLVEAKGGGEVERVA